MKAAEVTSGGATRTAQPARMLTEIAADRRTGSLVVDGTPGGTLHLVDGQMTYAESPASPGVGELLTASGRLAARTWEAALEAGSGGQAVGRLLVEQGHLTQGELELCVLGAVYDAAYFLLQPASTQVTFVQDAPHWLGVVIRVDAAAVVREARRRARLLDEIFPHPELDTAPVTPVPRPPVERVALTSLQWELLMHADGQRTPADLAQLLGRAGYATVQELRRLGRQGLLELPPAAKAPRESPRFVRLPRGGGPYADRERPAVAVTTYSPPRPRNAGSGNGTAAPSAASAQGPPEPPTATTSESKTSESPTSESSVSESTTSESSASGGTTPEGANSEGTAPDRPPRLPRRKPNARLPKGVAPADATTPAQHGADEVLLKRLRTALRALR